jgi:hypothetical protein
MTMNSTDPITRDSTPDHLADFLPDNRRRTSRSSRTENSVLPRKEKFVSEAAPQHGCPSI